ncbi:MAG: chromatin protein Cren7 [Fervidicoccaceae archaeon]|jgi:predicted RNA-binding Zn-ribbon protein involved in translation (DUF1610 family)
MPKSSKKANICPVCGTEVSSPDKTWNLVSPIPDDKGRITITVMGSFTCPNCGHKWKGVVSKLKVGGSEVEVEAGGERKSLKPAEGENRRKEEIIINIDDEEN